MKQLSGTLHGVIIFLGSQEWNNFLKYTKVNKNLHKLYKLYKPV